MAPAGTTTDGEDMPIIESHVVSFMRNGELISSRQQIFSTIFVYHCHSTHTKAHLLANGFVQQLHTQHLSGGALAPAPTTLWLCMSSCCAPLSALWHRAGLASYYFLTPRCPLHPLWQSQPTWCVLFIKAPTGQLHPLNRVRRNLQCFTT